MEALSLALEPVGFGFGGIYERQLKKVARRMAMARRMAGASIMNLRVAKI
jgi:hypothetical protein